MSKDAARDKLPDVPPASPPGQAVATYDFGEDAGKGMEGLDRSEYRIPFIRILDPKSPQCKPPASGGIPGAKGGSIFNTATGEVWDGEAGFDFLPCARDHSWVQFHARSVGGGFVKSYLPDDPAILKLVKEQGQFKKLCVDPVDIGKANDDQRGDQISEVFSLYGLMLPPGDPAPQRVVIGFGGMQIRKYTSFMTRYMNLKYPDPRSPDPERPRLIVPPLWAHRWHLRTTYEERKDQSWYGWIIRLATLKADGTEDAPVRSLLSTKDTLYQEAKAFHQQVIEGAAKADLANADPEQQPAAHRQTGDDGDEVPF